MAAYSQHLFIFEVYISSCKQTSRSTQKWPHLSPGSICKFIWMSSNHFQVSMSNMKSCFFLSLSLSSLHRQSLKSCSTVKLLPHHDNSISSEAHIGLQCWPYSSGLEPCNTASLPAGNLAHHSFLHTSCSIHAAAFHSKNVTLHLLCPANCDDEIKGTSFILKELI